MQLDPRSLARAAGAPLLVAAFAFLWMAWPGGDPLAPLASMDVAYHLHRIARCMADLPWVTTLDTYSHPPAPGHVPWPGGGTLVLALLATLLRASPEPVALSQALGLVAPLLGAGAAAAAVVVARQGGLREPLAIAAGAGAALSGDFALTFHRGVVDHHAWSAVVFPLIVLSWLRRSLWGWTAGAFVLGLTTPEAAGLLALLLAILIGCEGWSSAAATRDRVPRPLPFFLAPAAALGVAWLADRLLDPSPPRILDPSPFRLSLVQVACLLVLGIAGAAAALLVRRGRSRSERFSAFGGVLLGTSALMLLALLATDQLGPMLERLAGMPGIEIGDRMSPVAMLAIVPLSDWGAWAVLLLLVLGGSVVRFLVFLQRREPPRELALAATLCAAVALSLLSLGHARSLAPLVAVAVATTACDAHFVLTGRSERRWPRVAAAGWLLAVLLPPLAWHGLELRRMLRSEPDWPRGVGELAAWARQALPPAGPRDATPSRAILSPWEWGHHLNVLGSQPVVMDAFRRDWPGARPAWLAPTGDGFADVARSLGATHVAVGGGNAAMAAILRDDPEAPPPGAWGMRSGPWPSVTRRRAIFRLDESGGIVDESGRLLPLWISGRSQPLTIAEAGELKIVPVPAARLFEIVPGAEIHGFAPPAAEMVAVETRLRMGDGDEILLVRRVTVDSAGEFRFRTALPAPWISGELTIAEPHRLVAQTGEAALVVPVEAIRFGATLRVPSALFVPRPPPEP